VDHPAKSRQIGTRAGGVGMGLAPREVGAVGVEHLVRIGQQAQLRLDYRDGGVEMGECADQSGAWDSLQPRETNRYHPRRSGRYGR
jgi:hypothetical protein